MSVVLLCSNYCHVSEDTPCFAAYHRPGHGGPGPVSPPRGEPRSETKPLRGSTTVRVRRRPAAPRSGPEQHSMCCCSGISPAPAARRQCRRCRRGPCAPRRQRQETRQGSSRRCAERRRTSGRAHRSREPGARGARWRATPREAAHRGTNHRCYFIPRFFASAMIASVAVAPHRVHPSSRTLRRSSRERTPPAALIATSGGQCLRMSFRCASVAPL